MTDEEPRRLFAPWRFQYVSQEPAAEGCIFCAAVGGGRETLTLLTGQRVFALLNRYPYTSGHAMVAPIAHVAEFGLLDPDTLLETMVVAQRVARALRVVYHPHGMNLGWNLGEAAGAGIADHLHMHIVPRWRGDTSFMTAVGGVRVIPEELEQTWSKLRAALEDDGGEKNG
ncbi:MAG: HIT domain-containing protein [Acidobacteriota bacterium]